MEGGGWEVEVEWGSTHIFRNEVFLECLGEEDGLESVECC